jgi:hypothetical protein
MPIGLEDQMQTTLVSINWHCLLLQQFLPGSDAKVRMHSRSGVIMRVQIESQHHQRIGQLSHCEAETAARWHDVWLEENPIRERLNHWLILRYHVNWPDILNAIGRMWIARHTKTGHLLVKRPFDKHGKSVEIGDAAWIAGVLPFETTNSRAFTRINVDRTAKWLKIWEWCSADNRKRALCSAACHSKQSFAGLAPGK